MIPCIRVIAVGLGHAGFIGHPDCLPIVWFWKHTNVIIQFQDHSTMLGELKERNLRPNVLLKSRHLNPKAVWGQQLPCSFCPHGLKLCTLLCQSQKFLTEIRLLAKPSWNPGFWTSACGFFKVAPTRDPTGSGCPRIEYFDCSVLVQMCAQEMAGLVAASVAKCREKEGRETSSPASRGVDRTAFPV